MRPAWTLLSGVALSALLTSVAFATAEPERVEAGDASGPAITAPAAGTSSTTAAGESRQKATSPTTAAIQPRAVEEEPEAAGTSAEPEPDEASTGQDAADADLSDPATEPTAMAAEPEVAPGNPAGQAVRSKENTSGDLATDESTAEAEAPTTSAEPAAAAIEAGPDDAGHPAASEAAVEARPDQPADTASAEPVAEPSRLEPEMLRLIAEAEGLADDERSALTTFYEGRGDDLLWVSGGALDVRAESAMAEIRRADDWGLESSAFELPSAPQSDEPAEIAEVELKLSRAVLKYASHARGGRMNPRQLSGYIDRELPLLPPSDVLAGVVEASSVDAYLRELHPQHPQFEKLRQAYLEIKNGKLPVEDAEEEVSPKNKAKPEKKNKKADADGAKLRKILHNMEQWRWMPEDLGRFYVWANVPEFTLRVMRDGEPIHEERLIVGKRDTQTPIFSDEMETVVFHPFWGVPNSIKVKEILPGLIRGSNVLAQNDLRIQYRGRDIDPGSVDWRRTDIRNFHVYQPPSERNVLGVVKFLFPNKHAVYMHDTPTKHLFKSAQRMFSHGCMRVRDPLKFAEILLSHDKGWDRARVDGMVKRGSRDSHVALDTKIPVHMTYFTAWVEDDGTLKTAADIYGHEERIQMGLDGKAHLIAQRKENLGAVQAEVVSRLAETQPAWSSPSSSSRQPDWARRAFGN